jgi:hypothetical protein
MKPFHGRGFAFLFAVLLGLLLASSEARADTIFVANEQAGTIGEYTTAGATLNAALITGLGHPIALAVSGSDLFVVSVDVNGIGTIGKYTTSGATVNAALITGLNFPEGIAVSGSNLFVVNNFPANPVMPFGSIGEYTTSGATVNAALIPNAPLSPVGIAVSGSNLFVTQNCLSMASCLPIVGGTIGEYTTSGATVNTALISSGLSDSFGIAVSGSNLFVTNFGGSTIGEYTTSGATVNVPLISGLSAPIGIAVDGSDLFVVNSGANTVGEYTTSGATVNAALITGLDRPEAIAISPVPEPSSLTFFGLMLAGLGIRRMAGAHRPIMFHSRPMSHVRRLSWNHPRPSPR